MNHTQIHAGNKLGPWTLTKLLGRGGNGQVWRGRDDAKPDANEVAIKVLQKVKKTAYKRFCDEVKVLRSVQNIHGILPVIESHLPAEFVESRAWYAMPIATPIERVLQGKGVLEKVQAIREAAETLSALHERGVCHRDLKPANLLHYSGRCCVGDFGLVEYPSKGDLTGPREALGPKWTMAPEVLRKNRQVDYKAADVYSLAKTLWMLLTGNGRGFEGQYIRTPGISITEIDEDLFFEPLERILTSCTDVRPQVRPSMQELADQLREWAEVVDNFSQRNNLEWIEILKSIFPTSVPLQCEWKNLEDIVGLLKLLGARPNSNHLFFPGPLGGGLDLTSASTSEREAGCIELKFGSIAAILNPEVLSFASFEGRPQWSFFRLEARPLSRSGVCEGLDDATYEEVTDLGEGPYEPRYVWDDGHLDDAPLPADARVVVRYLKGAFLVVPKAGPYNSIRETYDARHDAMNAEEFRAYVERLIVAFEKA